MVRRGVHPPKYSRNLDALAALDTLVEIEKLGDWTIGLALNPTAPPDVEAILEELAECFANPLLNSRRVAALAKQIRGSQS